MNNSDTTISATARMWQGQYEYMGIDIEIKKTDSRFVKNISVTPAIPNEKFFPWFDHFVMDSYYYQSEGKYKGGPYWKDYYAKTLDQLPTENRRTSKNNLFVKYTAHYNSKTPIKFRNFSANIEVLLVDSLGQTATHKRHFDFYGERECIFSVH